MLASRWSFAQDLFLVAVLGATTLIAMPHRHHHRHHCHPTPYTATAEIVITDHGKVTSSSDALSAADVLYQRREFSRAADSLRLAAANDPSLEANAQLYDQLARAWDRAFAKDATPATRFEALRFARRIDLAIGGKFAAELDGYLRTAAPRAVDAYTLDHNREGLELALATCDALHVRVARSTIYY